MFQIWYIIKVSLFINRVLFLLWFWKKNSYSNKNNMWFLHWDTFNNRALLLLFQFFDVPPHRGRNQRYSFQIDLDYCSSTLKFLQFWNQNVVNILFLVVKSLKVTSGFNSKLMKKNSRWRHHWNIWHLSVKTKISPLLGRPQGSQGCQKMHHYPLKLDLKVWCSNIQPKLKKLWNSTKNQSFLMASRGFLMFIQFWLNIRAPNLQIQV